MEQTIQFEEGKPCPVTITGTGGGLSFSPTGDALLIGMFPNPTEKQIEQWAGKWRTKLLTESEFPAIPLFAIGGEDWLLETPCNPAQQEKEAPGFCEALYAKEDPCLMAVLVDSETGVVKKMKNVSLDEMLVERLVMSWNPFRGPKDQYNKIFSNEEFNQRIHEIFKAKSQKEIWNTSW